jgi:FdhD protein
VSGAVPDGRLDLGVGAGGPASPVLPSRAPGGTIGAAPAPLKAVTAVRALAVRADHHLEVPEQLATEEPLEIRAAGPGQDSAPVAVTMRTPGDDFDLAVGFLLTEGLVERNEVAAVAYCAEVEPDRRWNTVTVALTRPWDAEANRRAFDATASCGVCGKATIDDVEVACPVVPLGDPVPASLLVSLPDRLREAQRVFDRTGGLHAAGLFTPDGQLRCLREDVGRHNAVDKIVGRGLLHPAAQAPGGVLVVSGRVSFEIVQKAAMAGIGILVAVSAPSSLAVAAADRLGVTVAGFVREGRMNVYSHPERVLLED